MEIAAINVIRRCANCPDSTNAESGPFLCDNADEDCFFPPLRQPNFEITTDSLRFADWTIMCSCGHISPWAPQPVAVPTICPMCGRERIVKAAKRHSS